MIINDPNPESIIAYGGSGLVQNEIEQLAEIQKAFEAGADIAIGNLTGGQAGRVQSIEDTFKLITFKESAAAFWRDIPKDKATSTVLEWSRIVEVAGSVFYAEGGDVDWQQDTMDRQYDVVKFMGVKGAVTFVAKNVKMLQEAEVTETQNKTRSFVRGLDLALIDGNKTLNPLEFDGLDAQFAAKVKSVSQNTIDLQGKRLSDSVVNTAATIIASNYGNPAGLQLWLSYQAAETWVQDKIANKSYITNFAGGLDQPQTRKTFELENGQGAIKKDVFMRPKNVLTERILNTTYTAFLANHSMAPSVPTSTTTVEDTTTAYEMAIGNYDYAITSWNEFGESAALEVTVNVVATGKMVQFVLAESSPVTGQLARGYKIYRRAATSNTITDYYLVKKVGTGTQVDDGEFIPGCSNGWLIDWDADQVLCFKQLLPMYKLYYGIRSDKLEWLQKLYGTLQVFNANKIVKLKNIGNTPNS